MNKLSSHMTIASEFMYWTPSQDISSSASFSQPGEFINFKDTQICGGSSTGVDLQEYFYLDSSGLDHLRRKTE